MNIQWHAKCAALEDIFHSSCCGDLSTASDFVLSILFSTSILAHFQEMTNDECISLMICLFFVCTIHIQWHVTCKMCSIGGHLCLEILKPMLFFEWSWYLIVMYFVLSFVHCAFILKRVLCSLSMDCREIIFPLQGQNN